MRVLLDECLPRRLKHHIVGHDVTTVYDQGWAGTKNGALLRLLDGTVDAFVTSDQNLRYQQNLTALRFSIVVLVVPNNRLPTLLACIPEVQQLLSSIAVGQVVEVRPPPDFGLPPAGA